MANWPLVSHSAPAVLRILRLLLMEHIVLALPGAYFGLLVPRLLQPLMASAQPDATPLPLYFNVGQDGFVVAFAVLLSLVSGLLYGLWPSLRGTRIDLASVIKDGLSAQSARKTPVRTALVVSQVAMSFVLLVGTGLIVRSLEQARRADPGFDPTQVGSIVLAYGSDPEFTIEGHARGPNEKMNFFYNVIAPEYFRALRIGLIAGRDFSRDDDETAQPVTIVNETMARRFWNDPARAVGKRIRMTEEWRTVVGVVKDIKYPASTRTRGRTCTCPSGRYMCRA